MRAKNLIERSSEVKTEGENLFHKEIHLIFIENPKSIDQKDSEYLLRKNFSIKKDREKTYRIIERNFSAVSAFSKFLKQNRNKFSKNNNIEIYGLIDHGRTPYYKKVKEYFIDKGFNYANIELNTDNNSSENLANLKVLEQLILNFYEEKKRIFFNLTTAPPNMIDLIFGKLSDIPGKVYLSTNSGEVIVLPKEDNNNINDNCDYDEIMKDSLEFSDLYEEDFKNYNINKEIVYNTLRATKRIKNNQIIIERMVDSKKSYDLITFIEIQGIKISTEKEIDLDKFYFSKILDGLSYFKRKFVRVLINIGNGIRIYLGFIESGENLDILKEKRGINLSHLKKLLRSLFPEIEIEIPSKKDLVKILSLINESTDCGDIIGYPSHSDGKALLSELENALISNEWAIMTIGQSLEKDEIEKIINDLKREKNLIIRDLPVSFEELKNIKAGPEWEEWKKINRISKIRIKYLFKLEKVIKYFKENTKYGFWNTCNYILTKDRSTYNTAYSIFKSNYKTAKKKWYPIQIIKLDNLLKQFPKSFQLINVQRQVPSISNKFKILNTIYSSYQLSDFIFFPSQSLNNFDISLVPRFQKQFPKRILDKFENPIRIGEIKNTNKSDNPFYIDLKSINRHCLVMGSTGSGKTNTIINLLMEIRKKRPNFPFLIIEPIKNEYRHLKNLYDDIEIFTTGNSVNHLKINLFDVPVFLTYFQWINELMEIFTNSFVMYQPFREIIFSSLEDIYRLNGWSKNTRGRNPTLRDFYNYTKLKIDCSDYDCECRDLYKGSLSARFESLLKGIRGNTFNVNQSNPSLKDILEKPIILELGGLMNNEERILIFNLILKKLYMYQQFKGIAKNLRHITVIEEAHRLVSAEKISSQNYDRTIKMRTQGNFSDILSEIRVYGEGIILSEQRPKELMKSALTNTNLKICHKLPSIEQIYSFKDALALDKVHIPFITQLNQGESVIKVDEIDTPFFIKMNLVKDDNWGIKKEITDIQIYEKLPILEKINSFIFEISKIREKHFSLKIKQIVLDQNSEKKTINLKSEINPREYENFHTVFWSKIENICLNLKYCSKCDNIIKADEECPYCNNRLETMEHIKIPQLNISFERNFFNNIVKLRDLYKEHSELSPSGYSRSSQKELYNIRKKFNKIVENIYK